ncbi:KxYKxGKxW signal peptide domain-containing protein [Lactobacillus sp. LC28-10]|uniref:KxYKxGKxW signal peptide domain-containing protein n=1 Tax=Secundilactobacillus angelensis TaxID=2722706 RepID=A0ABX1KYY9_9LACO|nr:KxYKxGKxW signal peptide domain-containing protein [Secundilactobacillus angelensis]MCH5462650.1 KxYKxGKxW signal peptide domain-containing protein [Secundilactobacillus angelensis]NLR19142.1 KxYKxGKxW signal peptide domain-containing protein [Secundilactobacillus angelensis]
MSKNNLKSPFIEKKHRVKLYKKGTEWVAMGMTLATLAGISFATSTTAHAAGTDSDPVSTTSQTVPTTQSNGTTDSSDSNAGNSSTSTPTTATEQPQSTSTTAQTAALAEPTPEPAPEVATQTTNSIVTTTDQSNTASTDPANTGHTNTSPSVVTGDKVSTSFVTGGSDGKILPTISSDTTDLTDPTTKNHVNNGAVVAKDAVDFNTDFSLNATVNIKWDAATMGNWLGGDGTAVSFQPVSTSDALTKGQTGGKMGLVQNVPGTTSYIISTDAIGASPSTSDGIKYQNPHNDWVIYQAGSDSSQATGGVYDTGIVRPAGTSTGSLTYTFDVKYTVDNKQLVTNVREGGADGTIVKTFTKTIGDDQIGQNYVLGVTAATASSKAAYSVTINNYTYVPADAKLNITSNMPDVAQSGINGTTGQVIAFYQPGTTAPTTDNAGNAVSVAYAVPVVQGYHLSTSQFITLASGGENNIALNYVGDSVKAAVTIPTNKGDKIVANVSGTVGKTVTVSVPSMQGYTSDKSTVTANVNSDGSITVVTPDAQTGDAGYVTYTGNPVTADVSVPSNKGAQTVKGVTGKVGDTVQVTVPTLDGYTPDKTTVVATINPNGTITVNTPDAQTDDANFVTYKADTQTLNVKVGNQVWTTTGPSDSAVNYDEAKITALIPKGYTIEGSYTKLSDLLKAYAPANFDHDTTKDQSYTILLTHALTYQSENTTRTIHFVNQNGDTVSPDVVQTVTWVQPVDAVTGEPIDSYSPMGWYTSLTAPTVSGYTADNPNVTELKLTNSDAPANTDDVTVTYTGDQQTVIVKVGDKTWTTTGQSGDPVNYDVPAILALIPDGYAIDGQYGQTTFDNLIGVANHHFDTDTTKDQTITVPLAEKQIIQTVQTTRTIHFVDSHGNTVSPDVVQTVTWTRPVGAVTGDPTDAYTPMDWYTALESPTVTGYTPNIASVAADSPMITDVKPANAKDITVVYTGNQITGNVSIPSNLGPQTVDNVTGQVGETVTVNVPPIDGYTADKSTVVATVNPDGTITVNAPKAKPGDAGYVTYTANSTNGGSTGQPGNNDNTGDADNIPQTGNETLPTDSTTQPENVPAEGSDNGTATTPQNETGTTQVGNQATGHNMTATNSTVSTGASSATGQATTTQLSESTTTSGQSTAENTASGQLPQTNEQSQEVATTSLLGLMMLSLLGLFGIRRKRTDEK